MASEAKMMSAERMAEAARTVRGAIRGGSAVEGLATFDAILAHLDALQAPADGEALARRAYQIEIDTVTEANPDAHVRPATFDAGIELWRHAKIKSATHVYQRGYAAGIAKGEEERAQLAHAAEQLQFQVEQARRDAGADRIEIARLTAEHSRTIEVLDEQLKRAMAAGDAARADGARVEREVIRDAALYRAGQPGVRGEGHNALVSLASFCDARTRGEGGAG